MDSALNNTNTDKYQQTIFSCLASFYLHIFDFKSQASYKQFIVGVLLSQILEAIIVWPMVTFMAALGLLAVVEIWVISVDLDAFIMLLLPVLAILFVLRQIVLIIQVLSITVRRLRACAKSPWWAVLTLIPLMVIIFLICLRDKAVVDDNSNH